MCNTISLVSRRRLANNLRAKDAEHGGEDEPLSLLIRRKGGNLFDDDEMDINTGTSATLIAYELSRCGHGPKVYGVFNGGTVQEYIDSHTLTGKESADPNISKDIAISIAKIHAIKGLPLKKTTYQDNHRLQKEWMKKIPNMRECFENHQNVLKYDIDFEFLYNFEYEKELDWLHSKCNQLKLRKNFILYDMNYNNCLVRNSPKDGEMSIMLIDYDIAQYNYRGIDLGGHFYYKIFDITETETIINEDECFDMDQKRRFLTTYQQEIKRLNIWDDFDENGIDSIQNLLIESKIGQLIDTLFFVSYMMSNPAMFLDARPSDVASMEFMLRQFLIIKQEFEEEIK